MWPNLILQFHFRIISMKQAVHFLYLTATFLLLSGFIFSQDAQSQSGPVPVFEWHLTLEDDARLFVTELGAASEPEKTFVVLHSYGWNHDFLVPVFEPFSEDYRFVLFDLRGSYRSPAPDSTLLFSQFADDLEALRSALNLKSLNLITHGSGSMIALDYLGMHPEKVNRMIFISSPPFFANRQFFPDLDHANRIYHDEAFIQAQITTDILQDKLTELGLNNISALSDRERRKREMAEFASIHLADITNWRKVRNIFFDEDILHRISANEPQTAWSDLSVARSEAITETEAPVRVLIGLRDYMDPTGALWSEILRHVKDGRHITIEDAGHLPWVDRREAFYREFGELLGE